MNKIYSLLNVCIFRGFSCPKSVCCWGSAPATGFSPRSPCTFVVSFRPQFLALVRLLWLQFLAMPRTYVRESNNKQHITPGEFKPYRVRQKSSPLNFFAVFSATAWNINVGFYRFIYRNVLHLTAKWTMILLKNDEIIDFWTWPPTDFSALKNV